MPSAQEQADAVPGWLMRLPLRFEQRWKGYAGALAVILAAFAVRLALGSLLPPGLPFVTFFPAILIAAFLFGARPTSVAALVACGLAWVFFIGPEAQFVVHGGAVVALILFLAFASLVVATIHAMQVAARKLHAEREISRRLAENREALFLELQHRVGNNLQMVSSVLSLQRRKLNEPVAQRALDEASRRIALIGRVQRQLYDPDGARIGLDHFLERLVKDVIEASGRDGISSSVAVPGAIGLNPALAIPVALVVAEMVSNAIEHGLAGRDGQIRVTVAEDAARLTLCIADNGQGLPNGFDLAATQTMGLRLASSLAGFQGGALALDRDGDWTRAVLTFPAGAIQG